MIRVDTLKANISSRNKGYIGLASANTVDKITGNVTQLNYDYFTLNKINELTTISEILTYADGREENKTYYFIRINGCLRLISEQAFKLIENAVSKNKRLIKSENIPVQSALGQDYINRFYKYQEQF